MIILHQPFYTARRAWWSPITRITPILWKCS